MPMTMRDAEDARTPGAAIPGAPAADTQPAHGGEAAGGPQSFWQRHGNSAQIATAVVGFITVVVAIVAVAGAYIQISRVDRQIEAINRQVDAIRDNSRESTARQIYLGYLQLAFSNPQFAQPKYAQIKAGNAQDLVRYESYVSYFLYACEEAFAAFPSQREWHLSCEFDVEYHVAFLCEKDDTQPGFVGTYSEKLQQFVKAQMRRHRDTVPECGQRKKRPL
ncbi:MAG: hypothetical protein HY056_07445 [Proteobacteria bacterium]|nr:hypothetical protein [Pseudomonadota bacterium]